MKAFFREGGRERGEGGREREREREGGREVSVEMHWNIVKI